jgi:hypothetical protein
LLLQRGCSSAVTVALATVALVAVSLAAVAMGAISPVAEVVVVVFLRLQFVAARATIIVAVLLQLYCCNACCKVILLKR